jgi:Uma2 family endonuclease
MAMPAVERRWTAAEVRALIDANPMQTPRYELVDGELLVTPSPGPSHQLVCKLLIIALHEYLTRERVGVVSHSPSDIELEQEFITQPDVFVLPIHELRRVLAEGNPARQLLLAIEVLSPSSGRHDRVTKRPHYQRRVPEYWIVDVDSRVVERWRSADARPEIISEMLTWQPEGAETAFVCELGPLFAEALGDQGTKPAARQSGPGG